MKSKHVGSNFDDFLEEEGILETCKEESVKRVLIWQLEQEMKQQNLSKELIAQRMHTTGLLTTDLA